jgi:hypothetical protein
VAGSETTRIAIAQGVLAFCQYPEQWDRLRAGDKVVLWYVSGNRDEAEFAQPDSFDVGRSPNRHLSFGRGGPHLCLGVHLARLEVKVMLAALARRVSRVKIVLILTENWTMRPVPDVADLVTFAIEAERAGLDAVMVSEHIVLGPSSGAAGLPGWRIRRPPARRVAPAVTLAPAVRGRAGPEWGGWGSGGGVAGRGEHAAQVDDHLSVDVLADRMVEDLALGANGDGDLAAVDGDSADRVEQRGYRVPLDVVAHGVLEDLAQRVPVVVVEVR